MSQLEVLKSLNAEFIEIFQHEIEKDTNEISQNDNTKHDAAVNGHKRYLVEEIFIA